MSHILYFFIKIIDFVTKSVHIFAVDDKLFKIQIS